MIRIIPRLDIKNDYLVKGVNLEGLRTLGNPYDFIQLYYLDNADEIFYINTVSSLFNTKHVENILEKFSKEIFIPVTVGGGINSLKQIEKFLHYGADRVYINTAFLKKKKFLIEAVKEFGSANIVAGVEVLKFKNLYRVSSNSGRDIHDIKLEEWLNFLQSNGCGEIFITDVNSEGLKCGFDLNLLKMLSKKIFVVLTLHGGFSNASHIIDAIKINSDISGFSIASLFHYEALKFLDLTKQKESKGNTFFLSNLKNNNKKKFNRISNLKKEIKKKDRKILLRL
jgi:cyclase